MTTWKGYPQAPQRNHERPWWFCHPAWWARPDGWRVRCEFDHRTGDCTVETYAPDALALPTSREVVRRRDWRGPEPFLAAIDREHPLGPPEPRCGQVWVFPEPDGSRFEHLVTSVQAWADGRTWGVQLGGRWQVFGEGVNELTETGEGNAWRASWPPPGAVLVAGPQSPWADTREDPDA